VVRCEACGFVYLGNAPDYAELADELAWEKTFAKEKVRRNKKVLARFSSATRWRLNLGNRDQRRIARFLSVSGNVLDIGCGGSCRVPAGPTPFGIEISDVLAARAQKAFATRGGHVVHAPALEGLEKFPENFFSAILMRSFLEHEKQPRAVLQRALACLKTGGSVYVRVPNYGSINRRVMGVRWCGFRFPDHVNYFSEGTLKRLAETVGYSYRRLNRLSAFDDNLIVVLAKA
jgi:SAM-dependent methyltransferase